MGEPITAGNTTLKASHINELRTQIQNLRTDVDAGSAGAWTNGTGGDIYYNGGDVGIGITNPSEKLDVAGMIRASSNIQSGNGSGGVAMTINDGYGNANVTFNHTGRVPDITGNAGRIAVNVDSTTGANMSFQLANGLTAGTAANTSEIFRVDANGSVRATQYCDKNGNNCFIAGGTSLGEGQQWYDMSSAQMIATSYQNTYGRPIQVCIYTAGSDQKIQVSTNNASWINVAQIGSAGTYSNGTCMIVPTNHYYRIAPGGGVDLNSFIWSELR